MISLINHDIIYQHIYILYLGRNVPSSICDAVVRWVEVGSGAGIKTFVAVALEQQHQLPRSVDPCTTKAESPKLDTILGLVGSIPTPLKNISPLGLLFPIYRKYKMFQTTKQLG